MVYDQRLPAGLVSILLIRAGIEANPGPQPRPHPAEGGGRQDWVFNCSVCSAKLTGRVCSVQCNKCKQWCHWRPAASKYANCSKLKNTKLWNLNFICPACDTSDNDKPICDTRQPSQVLPRSTAPAQPPAPPPPTPTSPSPSPPPPPPPPHPPPSSNKKFSLKILQFNCNGIRNKLDEIIQFLIANNIKIAALQETKLKPDHKLPDIPNFSVVRNDRQRNKGGGVAFLIHESLIYKRLQEDTLDPYTENVSIQIDDTTITNLYIPPESSCPRNHRPSLARFFPDGDAIVVGDLNAHDVLWNSNIQDSRGEKFSEEIGASNFGAANTEAQTRLPAGDNARPSSPDVTLASLSLLPYMDWKPMISLGSDHLPIVITCATNVQPHISENKTYINFKKADWTSFTTDTEAEFSNLEQPTDVHKAEKTFRYILNKASKAHIPHGRIKRLLPTIPEEAKAKIIERDTLRTNDPTSPQLSVLNNEIELLIRDNKKKIWRDKISEMGRSTDSGKLFKLLRELNGQPPTKENHAIKFKGKYLTSATDIASQFNNQFSSVIRHKTSRTFRTITKQCRKHSLSDSPAFNADQTRAAIKKCKSSKAIGPDGLSNLHMKHLGPLAVNYLTEIFNISMSTSILPTIWKKSIIVPLLKPGKEPTDSKSYRPVSLLCPAIKLYERLLLPTLTDHLPIPRFQHGFRAQHSTVTALNDLNIDIVDGFNEKKPPARTVLLQIDLSKAFDMVSHAKLLKDLNGSTLPPAIKRWFNAYLHGRQSTVKFRNCTSKTRNVRFGVPQGAVSSPILFNFYLAKLPNPPRGIKVIQYADDISIYSTSKQSITEVSEEISRYIDTVVQFLEERNLQVSPEKSTVTLFTPDPAQFRTCPPIKIKGQQVKLEQQPKLLGVTFDTMLTFSKHANLAISKAKKRLNVLKSLAGTTWGQDKETIIITYKATIRSILEYGTQVWSPIISDTCWERMQAVQNTALRIATGCFMMSSIPHLHRETKVMPIREHSRLLTHQYLAASHLPGHPGREHLGRPPSARLKKMSVLNQLHKVSPLFSNNPTEAEYKAAIKDLHTWAVRETLSNYPVNKVLDMHPPEVNSEEDYLPRKVRCQLSQLRSGYSKLLNSYNCIIDESVSDTCPKCNQTPHNTIHLFNCPNNPTDLNTISLWTTPHRAASFLELLEEPEVQDNGGE